MLSGHLVLINTVGTYLLVSKLELYITRLDSQKAFDVVHHHTF